MNFSFLIQSRMGSSRFPGKALEKIYKDYTLIDVVYYRVMKANFSEPFNVVVLTSDSKRDDELVAHLINNKIQWFRGDENNVYKRYRNYFESISLRPDYFFRICGDNPFIEPTFLDDLSNIIVLDEQGESDYFSHIDAKGTPSILTHYGFFGELIKTESFLSARSLIRDDKDKEHVTPIFYGSEHFSPQFIEMDKLLNNNPLRLTFDTREDLEIVKKIMAELDTLDFMFQDVLAVIENNPEYKVLMKENIEKNAK